MARTVLFRSNRSQAVRLPEDVAFPDSVREVSITRSGDRRVIAPAAASWNDFFDAAAVSLPDRDQPEVQRREAF